MAARGALFAMAALAWLTLIRSYRRLRDAERVQRVLEDKVAEREEEVRRSYDKLRELERTSAIAQERERLMRDMHDGTGGQLVSALAAARGVGPGGAQVVEILQEALDDLRLTIESLDPAARDLPSLLGMMRATLERRVAPAGLRLVWQVGEAGAERALESEDALHLVRIVQEAVTNCIKHAGGAKVTIRTRTDEAGGVVVEICDDGRGASDLAGGRGVGNMRSRAAAMGGGLELHASAEGGTAVLLRLPA